MEAFGDRLAYAVTMNEPNLARLLVWVNLPAFVRDLERATLETASEAAGVERYRVANVVLPEDFDASRQGSRQAIGRRRRRSRPSDPICRLA